MPRVRTSLTSGPSDGQHIADQPVTLRTNSDLNDGQEDSIVVLGDKAPKHTKARRLSQTSRRARNTRRPTTKTSGTQDDGQPPPSPLPTDRIRRRSTSVIPESDVEAPRPPKPIRFRQFVEARFQPRPDTPELKRKRIPCGSPGPAIPCAKRPRLEEHNTDTVPQDLPTPTEDEDVPNVHRGEGEASDTHSRRPPSLVRHTENFEVALHSKPSPSSSSIPSPLSLSSFSSLPSSRTGQVAWKPTDFEPDQVDHVAQKQPETELNQLRKRLSFTEKALQQAQQDCNQERLARQATERNLFEAQDDRNRERVARHTAERARALGEKPLSEANATRDRSTLQLTDKIDALQETICDLEASLDRNASNYETALTDLASKHEDTVSDLEQKLEACAAGRKTDHEKLVALHRGLQEKLVVLQRELEVSNGIRKGAAKTIADQQGQLEIFEEFRKDAAKALKVSRDDLESSEDKRKAAVQRADHLQKELTDCEAREGEVNYILDTTIIEHNNAQAFLQQKLQDTEVSCQNAIGRADNLQAKLKGMDEKYEIANNRAQQLQSDLGIAQARLVEAVNTSEATRIELDMAVAKLDDKGKECETITKRAEQLDSALRLSEVQRLELQKSFDINSSKSSSQIRELTTQLQDMEQKYITAIARAEQLQCDLDLAEEFRLAADERNEVEADLERQLHEMEEKWKTSSRQADTLQIDLKGSQAEFEATRAELKTTQAELIESDVRRRGSVAKVEDLKKQLQDIEEKSKAESQRADQMQGELKLCETRRQAEATEHHSLAADLRKQLQDMKGHHKAAAQQAAQLTKELQAQRAVSEQQRADADARIAEIEDLRTQVQQSDVTFKAATQRITQQADELQLSHELYRRLEGEMELLREKHMALLITEMAKAQRIEQLQEALNRAEEGHLRAKIAQLRAEEGQLRAVTQLAEAQDQLADARAQQCESPRLAEMVERDVASLMTERDEALKARDDARVMAFFKIRELRDELAEIKKRYRRQETAIRLVATELLVNTRTRFAFHRDLMGVPKLQPDRSDGWICWKGLPDGLDNAKLERDLGPLNMGWLRIAISLLKEAECIVKFWHKAAINWQSATQQESQLRAQREEELRKLIAQTKRGPAITCTPVPGQQQPQAQAFLPSQGLPQYHKYHMPYIRPQQPGFSPPQTPTVPQGQGFPPTPGFTQPQGTQVHGTQPQGFPSREFPSQSFPPQGHPPECFPSQGLSSQGFPPHNLQPHSHPSQGFPPQAVPSQGSQPQNYPPQNCPPQNFPSQSFQSTGASGQATYRWCCAS